MERSGTLPAPNPPLDDLQRVVARRGPFLSIYLPLDHAVEGAPHQNEIRWRDLRDEHLSAARPEVLAQVDTLVEHAHHLDDEALAVVIADDEMMLAEGIEHLPFPEGAATHADVPMLTPIVSSRQRSVAFVLVLADRRGADLVAATTLGAKETEEIALEDPRPEGRVQPGGWSQRRFQQRALDRWEDGAEAIANEVLTLADQVDARLVVIGGEERGAHDLVRALRGAPIEHVRLGEATRAADSAPDGDDELRRLVHDVAARDSLAVIEKLREELGQRDRAVEGATATLAALQRAQVDVLLVHDESDDARRAWCSPDPQHGAGAVGANRADVEAFGVDEPCSGRLVDVAVRAALLGGAAVRVVPRAAGPAEGIGALLRWS